jgi:hypothetical protein
MLSNTRLARATRGVERRVFLKALALGLSLPVAAKMAKLATAQDTGALKRFMVLFLPHGMAPEHYNPKVNASNPMDFALDQTNESVLGPLEAYKQYVNVYQGFQYLGDAPAHEGVVNFLTGYQGPDTTTARTSVEHVIGNALGIKPLILGAMARRPFGLGLESMVFWNGTPIDPEKDPSAVADRLFKGGTSAPPTEPNTPNPELALRSELLKLTRTELGELQGAVSSLTKEHSKLQTHLSSVEALQASADSALANGGGGGGGVLSCSTMPSLPFVDQVRAADKPVVDSSGGNDWFFQDANFPLLFKAQLQLAAAALVCGAAPIVGLQPLYTTCDIDFTFAGTPGSHHNSLSHIAGQPSASAQYNSPISIDNYTAEGRAIFGKAQRWFTENLVEHLVSVLATTDDPTAPGTKVLDNTIIYWASEIADSANHLRSSCIEYPQVPNHLPLVTIGKGAGSLKTGQVYSAPINGKDDKPQIARSASDLYLTLAHAMGASNVTIPDGKSVVSEVLA